MLQLYKQRNKQQKIIFVPSIKEKEFIRIYTYTKDSNGYALPYVNTEALVSTRAELGHLRLVAKISKRLQKGDTQASIKQILNDIKLSVSSKELLQRLIVTFPNGLGTYTYDLNKQDFKKLISL